jgi:hypothetical protein
MSRLRKRLRVKVKPDGSIELPALDIAPGTEVDAVILTANEAQESELDSLALHAALLAEPRLAELWETAEEDAAWADS